MHIIYSSWAEFQLIPAHGNLGLFSRQIIIINRGKHGRILPFWCLNPKYNNIFSTFEVNLLNGLSNALLFALEIRDGGILELEPVLLISLQSQPLWPEIYNHIASVCKITIVFSISGKWCFALFFNLCYIGYSNADGWFVK